MRKPKCAVCGKAIESALYRKNNDCVCVIRRGMTRNDIKQWKQRFKCMNHIELNQIFIVLCKAMKRGK